MDRVATKWGPRVVSNSTSSYRSSSSPAPHNGDITGAALNPGDNRDEENRVLECLGRASTLVLTSSVSDSEREESALANLVLRIHSTSSVLKSGKIGLVVSSKLTAISLLSRLTAGASLAGAAAGTVGLVSDAVPASDAAAKARISVVDSGSYLSQVSESPLLLDYSMLVLHWSEGEARAWAWDLVLGHCRLLAGRRSELKLVLSTSASSEKQTRSLVRFFTWASDASSEAPANEPLVYNRGVDASTGSEAEVAYASRACPDVTRSAAELILQLVSQARPEDGICVCYLPNRYECERAKALISNSHRFDPNRCALRVLHDHSGEEDRRGVQEQAGKKHVVLLYHQGDRPLMKLPQIQFVVDAMIEEKRELDPRTGFPRLVGRAVPEHKADGRARGKTLRLCTEKDYALFSQHRSRSLGLPEIHRPETDLSEFLLRLRAWGLTPETFPFRGRRGPERAALGRAAATLTRLGIWSSENHRLTSVGVRVSRYLGLLSLPLARLMFPHDALEAEEAGPPAEPGAGLAACLTIGVSLLSTANSECFRRFGVEQGDHLTLLNIFLNFERVHPSQRGEWCAALDVRRDVLERVEALRRRVGPASRADDALGWEELMERIVFCFPQNTARLENGVYKTLRNDLTVELHPSSCLSRQASRPRPAVIVFHSAERKSDEDETLLVKVVSGTNFRTIRRVAPEYFE